MMRKEPERPAARSDTACALIRKTAQLSARRCRTAPATRFNGWPQRLERRMNLGDRRTRAVAPDRRGAAARPTSAAGLYDAWLIAETEASLALAAWRRAARADKRRASALYVDALAAEEAAAARLEQRLARAA
jgi:hypothetical protein